MFAKLVGEGFDRPNADNEMPLDVNYAKVADWLVDRRLIPQDWTKKLQVVQAKAAEAAKEIPPGFLGQFNGGEDAPVDYFTAKSVLAKLTETAERGLLGSLKGEAGTWERIVKAYEANLFNVAEGGLTLARNVDFEIPYFKKQSAKNQQLMGDFDRRAADSLKSAAAAAAEFEQELKSMGIPSMTSTNTAGLKAALLGLTNELPDLVTTAVDAIKSSGVADAASYYASFTNSLSSEGGSGDAASMLKILSEVREGRTERPAKAVLPAVAAAAEESSDAGGGIDWGTGGAEDVDQNIAAAGNVSWDLGGAAEDSGGAGISWDFEVVAPAGGDAGDAGDASGAAGISWDIDISGTGEESTIALDTDDALKSTGGDGATATSVVPVAGELDASVAPEVARVVIDSVYRAQLLDDLYELRAFLMQRISELSTENQSLLANAPADVAAVDKAAAGKMQKAVDAAIQGLTEGRTMQLISLASSAVHCDRLAAKLARQAGQEGKFRRAAKDAELRKAEAQRQLVSDSAKLAALIRRTREVKQGVEAALGTKLGRKVNVQGEINSVLS